MSLAKGSPLRAFSQRAVQSLQLLSGAERETLYLHHCSANLSGQKALTADAFGLEGEHDVRDLIVALRTCFVAFAKAVSASALLGPDWFKDDLRAGQTQRTFAELLNGHVLSTAGIIDNDDSDEFGWPVSVWDNEFHQSFYALAEISAKYVAELSRLADPFQYLYPRLLPSRLLHATGEFYTPFWMAELLIRDTEWDGVSSLIDPYCGSGVFLLAALQRASALGISLDRALRSIRGIEINSAACVAARANLTLRLKDVPPEIGPLQLPVFCADSILPDGKSLASLFAPTAERTPLPWKEHPAKVLVTNPPWVGWEYIPREYRRALAESWEYYRLFTATGMDKAFLKEDLSTLAVTAALDRYLEIGGTAALVMRPASMRSNLAGRELRRLRISPKNIPLQLTKIREFGFKSFDQAAVPAAAWVLTKGKETTFPVDVETWNATRNILSQERLTAVEPDISPSRSIAHPVNEKQSTSVWLIEKPDHHLAASCIYGQSDYQARVGVFTGGANAVFYLEPISSTAPRFRNITERARKPVPQIDVELEPELVYEIVRGRDLECWRLRDTGRILFPHTTVTRMDAIRPSQLKADYPKAYDYFQGQRSFLSSRNGFTAWEKPFLERAFYCLQRIGEYTFAPYKVCWKFVSSRFDCVVVGPDLRGRPRLANDKVMFIGVDDAAEAYYLCGILSSELFRRTIMGSSVSTQISTSAISGLALKKYIPGNPLHASIGEICKQGHQLATIHQPFVSCLNHLNGLVSQLYSDRRNGLSDKHSTRPKIRRNTADSRLRLGQ